MDHLEFVTLVARMRFFQNQYIRCRSSFSLTMAKRYENEVDEQINELDKKLVNEQLQLVFEFLQNHIDNEKDKL